MVEWLNEVDPEGGVYSRLGRYRAPLTEHVLLEAVTSCGIGKPRTITLSTKGCAEYVAGFRGERRYSGYETRGPGHTVAYAEDLIVFMAPGRRLTIEVSFGLPPGFLTVG